ncbi:MAG: iron hydrogenase [Clostridiales bacterium]|nr:iron hydrogenase [Clostridiales bacterium]
MPTFEELYEQVAKSALAGESEQQIRAKTLHFDRRALACLLHPEKYAPVWRTGDCDCTSDKAGCAAKCPFDAMQIDDDGNVAVNPDRCVGCSDCVERCEGGHFTVSRDTVPVLRAVRDGDAPVYAIVAPAFIGQFAEDITPGQLRAAFKALGFAGMVEVALFADILTLKEALEFDATIHTDQDFLLTSCCCPMWIAMIRKVYAQLTPHIPGAVSPMIACGRVVKRLAPGAKVVFIGPCLAKKAEAREPDIADAVDYVLTFQETQDIFRLAGVRPEDFPPDDREHSSRGGRIYARAGGVSEAVQAAVARLSPDREIPLKSTAASGVPACRALLDKLKSGEIDCNFLEGMGCVGGCVGGPRALIGREEGAEHVEHYGERAAYATPLDNPHVLELLKRLGFDTVEQLLTEDTLFTRHFA